MGPRTFHYAPSDPIWQAVLTDTVSEAVRRLVTLVRLPGESHRDDVSIALIGGVD